MSSLDRAMRVAKEFLDNEYHSEVYKAQVLMKLVFQEYNRRLEGIEHYEEDNFEKTRQRIMEGLSDDFGVDLSYHTDIPRTEGDKITYQKSLFMGIDTTYLYVSCWDGKRFETKLNRHGKKLVGLIHAIVRA